MRQISAAYADANRSASKEPVFVAKIINATHTIYLTTRSVTITDPGSIQIQGKISAAPFSSQTIKPEDGQSSIGGMSIRFSDTSLAFTTALNDIEVAGGSIYNDKVEIYSGFANIDFADYVKVTPLYVETFSNDTVSYTLKLSDAQRISKKTLFADPHVTELIGQYGYGNTPTIECVDPSGFPLVAHDADWAEDPSVTIGYVKAYGITQDGREAKEVISFTGKTSTQLTGVVRARFGTERVNLSDEDSEGNSVTVELTTMVYIDLVQPKMVYALLTGSLYGQVGQTLPDGWHAGLDPLLVSLTAIENIGGDLWQEHIEFRDLDSDDAKGFIAEQCLAPYGVFFRIDQDGQYEMTRYDFLSQQSAGDVTLNYSDIISHSTPARNAKNINNYFQINWEWRIDGDYYAREDYYLDAISQTKYKFKSPIKVINLRGLRNRDKTSKPSLDFVAQSQVKRYSNPSVTMTVTCKLSSVIEVEVGDRLALDLPNLPDFQTLETYLASFEVQGMSIDFLRQTATLQLFTSEGTPSEFIVKNGNNVVSIDTTGWTNLDGSGYGSVVSGTFEFTNGANIATGKYYYNGDVALLAGRTITANQSVYIDCANFSMGANAKIDMKGRGLSGDIGYFGGGDTSQGGIEVEDPGIFKSDRIWFYGGDEELTNGRIWVDLPSVLRVEDGQAIDGLIPSKLFGAGGGKGGDTVWNGNGSFIGSTAGGARSVGGGGLFISCDAMQYESSAIIDVSGNDNNVGGTGYVVSPDGGSSFNQYYYAGSSGFGWPGVCIVALKDRNAVKPFLYDLVVAKTGAWSSPPLLGTASKKTKTVTGGSTDKIKRSSAYSNFVPAAPGGRSFANTDFASEANRSAIHVMSLVVAGEHIPEIGVDSVGSAQPVDLVAIENINTPRSQLGNLSTFEVTATPAVGDTNFRYVLFDYRLVGKAQWTPIDYAVTTETTFTVTSSGDTYEIRATSYNAANQPGGQTIIQRTTTLVERDSETSSGGEPGANDDITLPDIRGLELVNRIDNGDNWNQWKSPNAEFRWLKMSNTLPAGLDNLNGATDLHLEGYKIRITDTDGNVVREEVVKDSFYTYTYDKNKKDNPAPIREFTFEVQAVSTTGYVSEYTGFEVANPAPAAPSSVVSSAGFTSIEVVFTLPTDVDFVGVDAYIMPGTGDPYTEGEVKRVSGNSIAWDNLTAGATYTFGLRSVDQFGTGGQITATGVQTRLIESSALGDITTPVVIDEVGGRLITNNSGYIAFHGATSVPAESSNPLIFGAFDGSDYPFWVDAGGQMKLAALAADSAISIGSSTFGDAGFQVENNSGNPRLNIGSGTPETSIQFENSALSIGEDVSIIGVDGYENSNNLYYHFYGHQLLGGLGRDTGYGTLSIDASYGKTRVTMDDTTTKSVANYQFRDGGEQIQFQDDFAWKVHTFTDGAGASEESFIRIGASNGFIDGTGSTTQAIYFQIAPSLVTGYNIAAFYNVNGVITQGFPVAIQVSGFITMEFIYSGGNLSATVLESDGTLTTVLPSTAVSFGNYDMRNAIQVIGKPYITDSSIYFDVYDFRAKGKRS